MGEVAVPVREGEARARFEDAGDFAERGGLIRHRPEDVDAHGRVEGRIRQTGRDEISDLEAARSATPNSTAR